MTHLSYHRIGCLIWGTQAVLHALRHFIYFRIGEVYLNNASAMS